jgi:hypothetical protein
MSKRWGKKLAGLRVRFPIVFKDCFKLKLILKHSFAPDWQLFNY